MGSKATVFGVRSTVSQAESSKEGLAQSGAWVAGSRGESPMWNFQGPLRATTLWPRMIWAELVG